jgi:hypothetical protein
MTNTPATLTSTSSTTNETPTSTSVASTTNETPTSTDQSSSGISRTEPNNKPEVDSQESSKHLIK